MTAVHLLLLLLIRLISNCFGAIIECPLECECDLLPPNNSTWAVYCHRGGINDTKFSEILSRLPLTLRSLDIQTPRWRPRNRFKWNDNLNRFSQLRYLRLADCEIPAMSRSMRLPSLELLDLRGNNIEHATISNFGGVPSLRHLDLSHNSLSILPTGVFTYLNKLNSLSLANNSITELSTNLLRGLRNLKKLHLDHNKISVKYINELFHDVPQLEELYLNDCQLGDIELLSLERVQNLRNFGLARNQLLTVPTNHIMKLSQLAVLDLSGNDIREIGPCAFCSNNVTRLDISHNLLGLTKEPIHQDAFRNTHLLELDLSFNHLNEFHSSSLGWAQETLQTLHMSGNDLQDFPPSITETLPHLQRLHMAFNSIRRIPVALPPQYNHLSMLNISGNRLSYLPQNLPYLLPHLKDLDIAYNEFSSLTQANYDFLNTLDHVYLHGNPWDCSCSVHSLQEHMMQRYRLRHMLHYSDTRCAEPVLLKGQSLLTVSEVHDCAVLFGARYGLTQSSELFILLAALLSAAILLSLLLLFIYCMRERQYKGSYVTREHSRTPLTMNHHLSSSPSSLDDQLQHHSLAPPMPPPPPKLTAAYFGI